MMQRDGGVATRGAWDTPEWKLRKCRDLSHQGQVLVTIVTSAAATQERSSCQEVCWVVPTAAHHHAVALCISQVETLRLPFSRQPLARGMGE